MIERDTAKLDKWIVQTKSMGRHLLVTRAEMPGLIHVTADADSLRVGIFRANHASLAASLEVRYQDLRSKPRLAVATTGEDCGRCAGDELTHVSTSAPVDLRDWRAQASQIVAVDYQRFCLEIRHLGRPGMIHLGADAESVSVEVWNHTIEQVVDAACVSFDDLRRSGRVS